MSAGASRIESVDVLRGLTMAFMLVVDNPGGAAYAPLNHADWNGFTPTDFVFPTFIFVMGVSLYLSLRKSSFRLSWRIGRRFLLLFGVGLLLNWLGKGFFRGTWGFEGLRILGVLQRIALCYGVSAVLVCLVDHKWLGWIAAALLVAYGALLLLGNGYSEGTDSILYRVDSWVLGPDHMYRRGKVIDPEGLLSTVPAVAHTLIGFLVGKMLVSGQLRKMETAGTLLLVGGLLLQWGLPLNKKVWSPSFVLVACGLAALLLGAIHYLTDERGVWKRSGFWKVFGTNAILSFILCDVLVWVMSLTGAHSAVMKAVGNTPFTSLLYALAGLLLIWLLLLPLYRRRLFLRL